MLPSLRASRSSTVLRSEGERLERYGQILALSRGTSDCAHALMLVNRVTRIVSAAAARFLRMMTISEVPCSSFETPVYNMEPLHNPECKGRAVGLWPRLGLAIICK